MTGVAKNTVAKLLVDLGEACWRYQSRAFVDLPCKRIECDEIWSFCGAKAKNVPEEKRNDPNYGDVWTWTAIDADSKLVPVWLVGQRDQQHAIAFMSELQWRCRERIQLTTDALRFYPIAVWETFHGDLDYATLKKDYGNRYRSEGHGRQARP
jgi:IS1 family transposase